MPAEQLFQVSNLSVLPGWLLLVMAPRSKWTQLISAVIIPVALALVYVALLVSQATSLEGSFSSLAGVARLFENPYALLAGWIHYLAFDLFIGSWEVRDAIRQEIRHWFVVPCLVFTFLFGPIGLLMYLVVRIGVKRRTVLGEQPA